jgi:hypothetical protein
MLCRATSKSLPENKESNYTIPIKVAEGIYVAGTLADGEASFHCSGSGAAVATDILTLWNNGIQTHVHDSIR